MKRNKMDWKGSDRGKFRGYT